MKYKVGDKVKLKSKEGLDELKQQHENLFLPSVLYEKAGSVCTIRSIYDGFYSFEEMPTFWAESLIEGLAEEETKPEESMSLMEEEIDLIPKFGEYSDIKPLDIPTMTTEFVKEHGLPCPDGYIFKDENGNVIEAKKIVLEKKKPKYPQNYEECCKVLGIEGDFYLGYRNETRHTTRYESLFQDQLCYLGKLLICRDAYWKLAGEEMGLGKPWKPDYDSGVDKFGIVCFEGEIQKTGAASRWERHLNKVLDFPTAEMRDAFYENFKELIEECKELL